MKLNQVLKGRLFCLTIMYSESSYHILINFILNKINQYKSSGMRLSYVLYFDDNRGSSVGLNFKLDSNIAKVFLNNFSYDLRSYLRSNPSDDSVSNQMPKLLFMNFPNNSIQYNVNMFFPVLFYSEGNDVINIWQEISDIILEEFSKSQFSSDELLEAGLKFTVLLAILARQKIGVVLSEFIELGSLSEDEEFKACYEDNKEMIETISFYCYQLIGGIKIEGITYMTSLSNLLNKFLLNILEATDFEKKVALVNLSVNFKKQLGITTMGGILIDYFVYRLLKEE